MRKKKRQEEAQSAGDRRLTPVDVQQVEFRLAFRGYSERDVDAFLDRVTEELSAYIEENERLRAGSPPPAMPQAWTVDTRAEADRLLAEAREQADAIVRRAEGEAAAIRAAAAAGPGVAGSGDTRAALAPFLNREREFLQSLGTLVQNHAEEIKAMVLALRAKAEMAPVPPASPESSGPEPSQPPAAPSTSDMDGSRDERSTSLFTGGRSDDGPTGATAQEISDRLGMSTATMADAAEGGEELVIVPPSATEPVSTSEGAPAGESRERSLRELFWGDD